MKNYETLEMSIIMFENADVITTSTSDNVEGAPDGWGGV